MMFHPDDMATITGGHWIGEPPSRGPERIGHDTRETLTGGMYVAIRGEQHDGHDFIEDAVAAGATMAMVDHDVEAGRPCLIVPDTIVALGRLASAWRDQLESTQVMAITGTAGKTTTKDLLQHVLSTRHRGTASPASWNNAIGAPMSLLRARPEDDYVILELGTSSPGEIATLAEITRPNLAIVTLVGHGHLEGLGSIEGVRSEKLSLLERIPPGGAAIVHDDGREVMVAEGIRLLRHGDGPGSDPRLLERTDGRLRLADGTDFPFPLPGRHHAINAMAVIAAARLAGMADTDIATALASARPSTARGTEETIAGVRFIDDAYNANPDSVAAALAAFPEVAGSRRRIVILGDMLELGPGADDWHAGIAPHLLEAHARAPIDEVLLVGEAIEALDRALGSGPTRTHWPKADEASIAGIADRLAPGDLVLLKASRGMRLERIVVHVRKRESEAATA